MPRLVYTFIHIYRYIHTPICTYKYIQVYIYTYVCKLIWIYIHVYVYISLYIYTHLYIYAHIQLHTSIHIYTYTYILDALAKLKRSLYFVVKDNHFGFVSKSFVSGLSGQLKSIQLGRLRMRLERPINPLAFWPPVYGIRTQNVYGFRTKIVYGFRPQFCTDSVHRISKTEIWKPKAIKNRVRNPYTFFVRIPYTGGPKNLQKPSHFGS